MKIKELLKKITLLVVMTLAFTSCDDEAGETFVQKTLTKDYVFTKTEGKTEIDLSHEVETENILKEVDEIKDIDIVKGSVVLSGFDGNPSELTPTVLTLIVEGTEVSFDLNLENGSEIGFVLPNPIALAPFLKGKETIDVILKLKSNEVLTDADGFKLILNLDARALIKL